MRRSLVPVRVSVVIVMLALGGPTTAPNSTPALAVTPAPALAVTPAPALAPPQGRRACKPDCRTKRCGTDGCGGTCGACPTGQSCHLNRCVKRPKDPCRALYGTWTGAMYLTETHVLKGQIWGTRHACFGRFHITFPLRGGRGSADETFTLSFPGKRVYFRGTRVIRASPGARYALDNFSGTVDYRRGRFVGVFHDGRRNRQRNTGRVVLKKK